MTLPAVVVGTGVLARAIVMGAVLLMLSWSLDLGWVQRPVGGLATPGWEAIWILAGVTVVVLALIVPGADVGRVWLVALAVVGWVGPLLAAVPGASPSLRLVSLAVAPVLPAALVALVLYGDLRTTRFPRALVATLVGSAIFARGVFYDPLLDPGCSRYCLPGSGWWTSTDQPRTRLVLAGIVTMSVLALLAGRAISRSPVRPWMAVSALTAAVLALVPWWASSWPSPARADDIVALAVLAVVVPVAIVVGTATLRRSAARRMAESLLAASPLPDQLRELERADDLTPALRLAIDNARLEAAALDQIEELRRSRTRIVQASDAERRRLGRELHDTVQQRVVGALLQLRIAADEEPNAERRACLLTVLDQVGGTLPHLRGLSERSAPPVVESDGLAAAVRQRAADLPGLRVVATEGSEPPPLRTSRAAFIIVDMLLESALPTPSASELGITVTAEAVRICVRGPGVTMTELLLDRVAASDGIVSEDRVDDVNRIEVRLPCGS